MQVVRARTDFGGLVAPVRDCVRDQDGRCSVHLKVDGGAGYRVGMRVADGASDGRKGLGILSLRTGEKRKCENSQPGDGTTLSRLTLIRGQAMRTHNQLSAEG